MQQTPNRAQPRWQRWTEAMDERLVAGVLADETFRTIAAAIGVTRNSAIGRWARIRRMV